MLASVAERPLLARAVAFGLFALVLGVFALPFATLTSDLRRAEPSGLDLATGGTSFSGRYVHDAYRGQVERLVDDGRGPALVALVFIAAALVLVWLPWRLGPAAGVGLAFLALLALLGLYQATRSTFSFAQTDRSAAYWLTIACLFAAGGWCAFVLARTPFWWKPEARPARDYFHSSDEA